MIHGFFFATFCPEGIPTGLAQKVAQKGHHERQPQAFVFHTGLRLMATKLAVHTARGRPRTRLIYQTKYSGKIHVFLLLNQYSGVVFFSNFQKWCTVS